MPGFSAESVEGGGLKTVASANVKSRSAKCWFQGHLASTVRWPRGWRRRFA